jgi:hypothetical protein
MIGSTSGNGLLMSLDDAYSFTWHNSIVNYSSLVHDDKKDNEPVVSLEQHMCTLFDRTARKMQTLPEAV